MNLQEDKSPKSNGMYNLRENKELAKSDLSIYLCLGSFFNNIYTYLKMNNYNEKSTNVFEYLQILYSKSKIKLKLMNCEWKLMTFYVMTGFVF